MRLQYITMVTVLFLLTCLSYIAHSHIKSIPRYTTLKIFKEHSHIKSTVRKTINDNASNETKFTKIFIGNLPFTITKKEIENLIDENVGKGLVVDINIAYGKKSKAPRGYCFVDLINEEAAVTAASVLNEVTCMDRQLNSNVRDYDPVKPVRKQTRIHTHKVFVTNLDTTLTELEILNMCEDILGPDLVRSLDMPSDKLTGRPRGIAYIEFKDGETATRATFELNGLEVLGRVLVCIPFMPKKISKPKDDQKVGEIPPQNMIEGTLGNDDEIDALYR